MHYDRLLLKGYGVNKLDALKNSLDYIEDNLRGEVNIEKAAKKACLSKFYYYRMFNIVSGMTLSEYIRNRKMSLAAKEIKESGRRILDIALDYGYNSQEAFSRAFKNVHGISPSQAKTSDASIKAFPPISFQLQLKGDVEMEYRIEKKEEIQLLGVSKSVTSKNGENFEIIPKFWQDVMQDGTFAKIAESSDAPENSGCYGVCMDYVEKEDRFNYVIGMPSGVSKSGFNIYEIPEDTYAVFGPVPLAEVQDLWKRIFSEWLPATDYDISNGPQVEFYPATEDDSVICEVWIPIKK